MIDAVLMECSDCVFAGRCSRVGASPLRAEKNDVQCVMQAVSEHGTLVSVPARLAVDGEGKIASVQVELVLFRRRGWWRRLLRRG